MPRISKSGRTVTVAVAPGLRVTAFRDGRTAQYWRIGIAYRGRVASIHITKAQRAMGALLDSIRTDCGVPQ